MWKATSGDLLVFLKDADGRNEGREHHDAAGVPLDDVGSSAHERLLTPLDDQPALRELSQMPARSGLVGQCLHELGGDTLGLVSGYHLERPFRRA